MVELLKISIEKRSQNDPKIARFGQKWKSSFLTSMWFNAVSLAHASRDDVSSCKWTMTFKHVNEGLCMLHQLSLQSLLHLLLSLI